MRSFLVPLVLLCFLCDWEVQAQDNVKALRLCGREFLRAVVYTCGGSRWRRLTGEIMSREDSGDQTQNSPAEWGGVPMAERRRRELNQALTTVCCQVGCRKSDLSILCKGGAI